MRDAARPTPDIGLHYCYVELHIEQGPILENNGKTIGVVTGGQGIRWYEISLHGEETHAGPVPMRLRKDPVPLHARMIDLVHEIGGRDPQARCTIGQIRALPRSINVVPGRIEMTVDLRHPDEIELEAMHDALMRGCSDLSRNYPAIRLDVTPRWHSPVVRFDTNLANLVRSCAERLGFAAHDMASGAGHDAFHLARRMPTVMIFVPCRDGISHNPQEYASPQDVAAGADVLLSVVLDRAMSRG
ncbi:hydantoinase/carbamoylase family amidase [Ensifer adhaerens]|uniref:hydantoinase/carbamoylase family amidase n=1 Tax=Ensifer adhaerens TaxID=106592 RepID=UPI00069EBB7E|nr:hydantoinase/carbamoylase family amidase [Ensifer adhaerens]